MSTGVALWAMAAGLDLGDRRPNGESCTSTGTGTRISFIKFDDLDGYAF